MGLYWTPFNTEVFHIDARGLAGLVSCMTVVLDSLHSPDQRTLGPDSYMGIHMDVHE